MKEKLYRCDPDINFNCSANHCYRNGGPCKCTTELQYEMGLIKRIKEWFKYGKSI